MGGWAGWRVDQSEGAEGEFMRFVFDLVRGEDCGGGLRRRITAGFAVGLRRDCGGIAAGHCGGTLQRDVDQVTYIKLMDIRATTAESSFSAVYDSNTVEYHSCG